MASNGSTEWWIEKEADGNNRAYFETLSLHLAGGAEENYENLSQDSLWPSQNSKLVPSKYKPEELPLEPPYACFAIIFLVYFFTFHRPTNWMTFLRNMPTI
jgi:hypothetical protein